MPALGKPAVKDVSVESIELPDVELPQDNDKLFEKIRNDPQVDTADMRVEGDWTYGTIADRISMEERVNNNKVQWDGFKKIQWDEFVDEDSESVLLASNTNLKTVVGKRQVSLNELTPPSQPQAIIDLGAEAPGLESSFASGDPGLGVPSADEYMMDGRAGTSSAVVYNGSAVLDAKEGTRAVAYNPPGGADMLQMINRRDWGHQARAVLESIKGIPGLGTSDEWKVPSFSTASGTIALASPYTYSYTRALGVGMLQSQFDLKMADSGTVAFTLRQPDGSKLTSTSVDVDSGGQSVAVNFINAPPNGIVEIDSGDKSYTVANTEKFPPV
jgi:hypothetical protein